MLAALLAAAMPLGCLTYYTGSQNVSQQCQAAVFLELAEADWLDASSRYADDNRIMDDSISSDSAADQYRVAQNRYVNCLHDGGKALAVATNVTPRLVQLAIDRCTPELDALNEAIAEAPELSRSPLFDVPIATRLRARLHLLMLAKRAFTVASHP